MARSFFPGSDIIVAAGSGSPAVITLAPASEFKVYSAKTGGTQLTDLKAADGATNLPVAGSGNPYTDSQGVPPDMWGPDGVNQIMWMELVTGSVASSKRFPMIPSDRADAV